MIKRIISVFAAVLMLSVNVLAASDIDSSWEYLKDEKYSEYGIVASVINNKSPSLERINSAAQSSSKCKEMSVSQLSLTILAVKAARLNPADIYGNDLLKELSQRNLNAMQPSQINELMLAVAASQVYETSYSDAKWTSDSLLQTLLSFQNDDGGFKNDIDSPSDISATRSALIALSFFKDDENAVKASEKAVEYLATQKITPKNCEEAAVLIYALCSNGISADDERFYVGSDSLYDYMMSFKNKNGGFVQTAGDASANVSATEQAMLAVYSAENMQNPLDITNIDYTYAPPSAKDSLFSIIKKLAIVLVIIYISLIVVNYIGKKKSKN